MTKGNAMIAAVLRRRFAIEAGVCPACGMLRHEEDSPIEKRIRLRLERFETESPVACYICLDGR